MARKKGRRQETPDGDNGGKDGDNDCALWAKKAGRGTGFDFTQNCAFLGDGPPIPVEFLEDEARRDQAVYGRVIPLDSVDFVTVQESFYRRLEDFERNRQPDLLRPASPFRAHAGANSRREEKMESMDGHPGRESPSINGSTDAERYARSRTAPRACPKGQNRVPLSLPPPVAKNGDNDISAFMPDGTTTNDESDDAPTTSTRQTPQRSQDESVDARSAKQCEEKREWRPGTVAMYERRTGDGAQRFVTVQVTTVQRATKGGMFSSTDERGNVAVTDGEEMFFVPQDELTELSVSSELVARLQSGAGVSPSETPQNIPELSKKDVWAWLTPLGLAQAQSAVVPVPKRVVPHLVGKGGATIRMIEELIGTIIGVTDGDDGLASISITGPQQRVTAARAMIQAAAGGGAWSLFHRIKDRGPCFV